MLLQGSTKRLLSVFPAIHARVDLRLPNQSVPVGGLEGKRPVNLIQCSLVVASLLEDPSQSEMCVGETGVQRERHLTISISEVKGFGNSPNCVETGIGRSASFA